MRLPALTPAHRAQRRADILARCIAIADTPEDAARFRAGYQLAAARAASLTSADVPTGVLEAVLAALRSPRLSHLRRLAALLGRNWKILAFLSVFAFAQQLAYDYAPAWFVNDARWFVAGAAVYAIGFWVRVRWFPGRTTFIEIWVEEDSRDE